MDHAGPAHERPDKSHHEINRVIRGQNAQIAHPRPKGIPRRQRSALLQIAVMCQHTSLRTPARPRRINDARRVLTLACHQLRLTLPLEFFPAISAAQVRTRRRFRHQHNLNREFWELRCLRDGPPQIIFHHQKSRLRMRKQLQMLRRGQFVIQRNQHTAREENRIGRNQPLRLIRHDNRRSITCLEIRILKCAAKRARHFPKVRVGKPHFFAITIGFNEAGFVRPALQRILERCTQAGILTEIKHSGFLSH